jgi:hemerythrin-like domain-containing protein
MSDENLEDVDFRIFAKRIHEIVWHIRRHIDEENSFVIPLTEKFFTEDS